jgi:hypothetical protein
MTLELLHDDQPNYPSYINQFQWNIVTRISQEDYIFIFKNI